MKYSRQRELVREAVEKSSIHPTADEVYQEVRKREPTISLATVYRNLNQLSENHLIRRVVVPGYRRNTLAHGELGARHVLPRQGSTAKGAGKRQ